MCAYLSVSLSLCLSLSVSRSPSCICINVFIHTHELAHTRARVHTHTHAQIYTVYICISARLYVIFVIILQGGEDAEDALSCRSLFEKKPLIIGLFCGKWPIKIRHLMGLRHPVVRSYRVSMISRLLQIIGLFCKISSLLWGIFARETCNFEEATNCIHSICLYYISCGKDTRFVIWAYVHITTEESRSAALAALAACADGSGDGD